MSNYVPNTNILSDSFETLTLKVNRILDALSTEIVTANSTYANTGNSTQYRYTQLLGGFAANTVIVTDSLKGGNINGLSANLSIDSNTNILGQVRVGNTTVNSTITSTTIFAGNSTVYITIGNNALDPSSTLNISNSISVSGRVAATGNAAFGGTELSVANDYTIQMTSNGNLGTNISTSIMVYRFPKATFSSGKFTAQIKNQGNTQISEMVLAHDTTSAYVTVFGTVASPPGSNSSVSPLGTFSANVNNANVELLFNQTIANSSIKILSELIK